MIARGIRHHQNWRIGPFRRKNRRLELWIVQRILLRFGYIFVIIVVFIHSWWNLNNTNNWCISVCMEKQVIWRYLRNFERSYHLSYWQWLNLNLDTKFIVHIWLNWYHDSVFIYIIVGEWYRSHICGHSLCLRCTSCTRRRVQSAEKQVWPLLPTTSGLPDYYIVLLGCQK